MMRLTKREIAQSGFTLMEILVAIVVVAIVVPSILAPFSQLKNTKTPEYVVEASFLAQRQIEAIAGKKYSEIPTRGNYTCAVFETSLSLANILDCANASYSYSWVVDNVTASAPDTPQNPSGFAKRVTLTVTRTDGAISPLSFYFLFAQ